jgi:ABC-2 type transport system permease protein
MFIIAIREYLAAVRTKSFLVGLLMMPILMGGGAVIQLVFQKLEDTGEKRFAVIDRTKGQHLFETLDNAARRRNAIEIYDPDTGKQVKPKFIVERIQPSADSPQAMEQQRFELSNEMLDGKYFGLLEIGPAVYEYQVRPERSESKTSMEKPASESSDRVRFRYQSRTPQYMAFSRWAELVLNEAIQAKRWSDAKQPRETIQAILQPVPLAAKGLTRIDEDGEIRDAPTTNQELHFLVPITLVLIMFMMIMIGATPLVSSVLEEKNQRIAEVLLGSVQPFPLMMGKLIGMVGVSLTIVSVYLAGGAYAAWHAGYAYLLSAQMIAWFLLFLVLAVVMYGSVFIAVGSACTTTNETQTMLMPVIMFAVLPMMVMVRVIQEPNSTFATLFSFFPPATPMLMVARQAVPPGLPWWQPLAGALVVLAATTACVYAAGRIFRVGILVLGKGAKLTELMKWVLNG